MNGANGRVVTCQMKGQQRVSKTRPRKRRQARSMQWGRSLESGVLEVGGPGRNLKQQAMKVPMIEAESELSGNSRLKPA
eukprot:1072227-Pleurochrysis_carterae.AAC.2